jgi:hypothetical protein
MKPRSKPPAPKPSKRYANSEYNEYLHNAKERYPEAFRNKKDFVQQVSANKIKRVPHLQGIRNTDAEETANNLARAKKLYVKYKKDSYGGKEQAGKAFDKLHQRIASGAKVHPSIVGIHRDPKTGKKSSHLIAGNTRAMIHRAMGKPVPVVHVRLKGRKNESYVTVRSRMSDLLERLGLPR